MLTPGRGNEAVERLYHRLAPVYDPWASLFASRVHDLARRRAALRDGESFLEVAVGTGLTFAPMAMDNPSGRNEGIDLCESMLRRCRRRLTSLGATTFRLRRGDARDLPFDDESFDLLLCCHLFDLLSEDDFAVVLRQFHRVLRDCGRLVVASLTTGGTRFKMTVGRVLPAAGGLRPVELGQHMLAAGFTDVSRHTYSQNLVSSELIRAVKIRDNRWFNLDQG
jgi:ubiquinone/menaquinone biosynthesis C-methylase UbiE